MKKLVEEDPTIKNEELEEVSGGIKEDAQLDDGCIIHDSCICKSKSGFADEDDQSNVVL
ncbi:MAG: hypothetical protein LBC84_02675 [Prevotellaceae bacterium]|jgi:hypothetical protein|nr:hypothetical protein [Prevotellaceae bacterium]